MISTLYLLQFIAFYLWQVTSRYSRQKPSSALGLKLLEHKQAARITGALLLLIAAVTFVFSLGLLSGLCGFVIGLMGAGCLAVVLDPFRYLRLPGIALLYACCVVLEILL